MNIQLSLARAIGAASTWGLQHVFHRPAGNFPGKAGLYADPRLIEDLRPRIREGTVVVAGTNGKTTVTNLVADALEASGKKVVCNRTGANLDSGVASALLHENAADWGVFESDELWLPQIASQLKPDFIVLLNLFRDQLDRMGEIALIQDGIVHALQLSPTSVLVYNCDDPLCQAIAESVDNACVPFGIGEDLGLAPNMVSDAGMCQACDALLEYRWQQYGQLGNYACPCCGFVRTQPHYEACDVISAHDGTSLTLRGGAIDLRIDERFFGAYMIYNVLATYATSDLCGVPFAAFERAVHGFDPRNGRLQHFTIDGGDVVLNLAKNPVGFNQNLRIVTQDPGPKAVAFFVNDKEADGHDVSWLWDVDFQELVWANELTVFAGGMRRNDVQVRLKHAGISVGLIDGAADFIQQARALNPKATCYLVANYTALPWVKDELDHLADGRTALQIAVREPRMQSACDDRPVGLADERLKIVHLYPTLLNLYGDGGNVTVLANRARWRGVSTVISKIEHGQDIDLSDADIVFLGGGPDREQHLAASELMAQADALTSFVEDDGVLLAICGGFQLLGREWVMANESVPGLGILDVVTRRAEGNSRNRIVGNIALRSQLAAMPVIGYENHAGRTYLGGNCKPFGQVIGRNGFGNNDSDGVDGALHRNVVGTYLHGPLLAKNPEIADWLIERALARRAAKEGRPAPKLAPLRDAEELAANDHMRRKLKV